MLEVDGTILPQIIGSEILPVPTTPVNDTTAVPTTDSLPRPDVIAIPVGIGATSIIIVSLPKADVAATPVVGAPVLVSIPTLASVPVPATPVSVKTHVPTTLSSPSPTDHRADSV